MITTAWFLWPAIFAAVAFLGWVGFMVFLGVVTKSYNTSVDELIKAVGKKEDESPRNQ